MIDPRITAPLWMTAVLVLLAPVVSIADGPVEDSQAFIREAALAYRNDDLTGFVDALDTAYSLNPASLSTRYNLACAYALTDQANAALDILETLVAERIDFGMAADPDLESLRELDRFQALVAELEARTEPVIASVAFHDFPQYGLVPEGIARDPATGRLFFGSMRTGEVYVVDTEGRTSRFATLDPANRLSAVGMTVDNEERLLWAVGAAFDLAENAGADPAAVSGLFGLDLESGALRETLLVASPGDELNDVVLAPDGTLYATGSHVFVADREAGLLHPIETSVEVFGSNGIAVAADGSTLLVSSYPVGLFAVDARTGVARELGKPADTTLYGIDGLYWHEGRLIGVQNGARPWRLVRLRVDPGLTAITSIDILEMGNDATTPMTGAIDGSSMYYVGETPPRGEPPAHFPAGMSRNHGAVTIRKASLGY